jgi:hypothetical protein
MRNGSRLFVIIYLFLHCIPARNPGKRAVSLYYRDSGLSCFTCWSSIIVHSMVVPIQNCGSLREEHEEREQTFCYYLFIIALHTSQQPGEESSSVHNTPFASTPMGLHKPRRLLVATYKSAQHLSREGLSVKILSSSNNSNFYCTEYYKQVIISRLKLAFKEEYWHSKTNSKTKNGT